MNIIAATTADLEALKEIAIRTFSDTFGAVNTPENMQKYLSENFNNEMNIQINDPDCAFFLAKENEKVIGYLKLNFNNAQTELQDKDAVEIERIYALKEYHGKQAGQLMLQKAFDITQQRKAAYIWLAVWEKNERAIAFYLKNGFKQFGSHDFILGNDVQKDLMMKKSLVVRD